MSILYGLPLLCDVLLYFAALGLLGLLGGLPDHIFWTPMALFVGCALSGRLLGRGRWRWLGLAAALPCLMTATGWGMRLAILIPTVYMGLYIANNRRPPDYYDTAERFRYSLIPLGIAVLLALMFQAPSWTRGLVYLMMYFALSVTMLRVLRHDIQVARSPRFRVMNLMGVAGVCAVGYGLSRPEAVEVLRRGWRLFADYILLNILRLIGYAFELVFYLLSWLVKTLGINPNADMPQMPQMNMGEDMPVEYAERAELSPVPPVVRALLMLTGILLAAVIVFLLLRALSRRISRTEERGVNDVRETLPDEPASVGRRPRRRGGAEGVRYYYRKALLLVRAREGRVTPCMNTLQIEEENAAQFDPDAMKELRRLYLPARYGEGGADADAARQARAAYERLKRG